MFSARAQRRSKLQLWTPLLVYLGIQEMFPLVPLEGEDWSHFGTFRNWFPSNFDVVLVPVYHFPSASVSRIWGPTFKA